MSVVADIILADVAANLPAASSSNDGYLYFETDTLILKRSNGSAWVQVSAAAVSYVKADGSVAFTGDQSMGSHKLTNVTDPASAQDAATKNYVDSIAINLGKRARVRAATTTNITIATALNNADTLDGVALVTGDLVLVKDQSAAEENGIYVVGVSPARFSEYDTYNEHPGSLIAVQEGTANADTAWLCTSNAGGTLNTTAIDFSALSTGGAGSDTSAIHTDTPAEIDGLAEKTTPVPGDWVVIEDSEDSYNKKKVDVDNLPGGGGGGTILKVIWSPDAPPASPSAYDSEFNAGSAGVPSGFTEYDPGSIISFDESSTYKKLVATITSATFAVAGGIYRAIPAGDFTIWTKVRVFGKLADYSWAGLALWEDATDNSKGIENFCIVARGSAGPIGIDQFYMTSYNTYNTDRLGNNSQMFSAQEAYLRMRRNGTTYYIGWSENGEVWYEKNTATTVGFTPTHFGLSFANSTGVTNVATADFFRYVGSDVGLTGIMPGAAINLMA